jgi:hypothetical protein
MLYNQENFGEFEELEANVILIGNPYLISKEKKKIKISN